MRLLVCFDVTDDKTRLKLVKVLESFGKRCQFSIFEVNLDSEIYIRFKKEIDIINFSENDKLFIYPIPEESGRRIFRIGPYIKEEDVIVV